MCVSKVLVCCRNWFSWVMVIVNWDEWGGNVCVIVV